MHQKSGKILLLLTMLTIVIAGCGNVGRSRELEQYGDLRLQPIAMSLEPLPLTEEQVQLLQDYWPVSYNLEAVEDAVPDYTLSADGNPGVHWSIYEVDAECYIENADGHWGKAEEGILEQVQGIIDSNIKIKL